jgi:hypothetical protein
VVAAAFDRLAGRILTASSAFNEGTLTAVRNTLAKLRSHIDGDSRWVDAVILDGKTPHRE